MEKTPNLTALAAGKSLLLFDGDCGICHYLATAGQKRKSLKNVAFMPYQANSVAALAEIGLSLEACNREVKLVLPRAHVAGGAFAVNLVMQNFRLIRPLILLLELLPGALLAEIAIYRWIAARRARISAFFGLSACRMPEY